MAALRAHLTQVGAENDFFRLSELVGPEAMGIEYFRLAGASWARPVLMGSRTTSSPGR